MKPRPAIVLPLLAVGALLAIGSAWLAASGGSASAPQSPLPLLPRPTASVPDHRPEGHRPLVDSGRLSHDGSPALVACGTCHTTREPKIETGREGLVPATFHQGLSYSHGGLSCLSCHNSADYDTLRRADGSKVEFYRAQQLCAQCHGPQTRDYLHGSHGGMNGHWDLTRGERTRRTCTDCHDPHAPAYPVWSPVFPPRDEGARQQADRESTSSTSHHRD